MLKQEASNYIKFANPIHDNNLELARTCLQAFRDRNDADEEIIEELDLIDGLMMMYNDFGIDMLPIKVKQYAQPRIDLIETLLRNSRQDYKKVSKVLQLSRLLRVCREYSDDYREGIVLSIIGKQAIQSHDCQAALEVCKMVLDRNLKHAWDLCFLIAKMADLNDLISSYQLLAFLSFALAYCPESDVDAHFNILNEIKSIKSSIEKDTTMATNTFIEFKGELLSSK